jgi:hypothetical protein
MLTQLIDLPDGALGFSASGRVSAEDERTVLAPALDRALQDNKKLRLMYVAGPEFDGYEWGQIWDDAVFGSRHFGDFEKVAFVSDQAAYRRAVATLEGLMPTALKVFRTRDLTAAKAWLAK